MDTGNLKTTQLRYRGVKESKKVLGNVFILLAIVLMVLPLWNSFQDVLTRGVMNIGWYKSIQNVVVPHEINIASTVLTMVGFKIMANSSYLQWVNSSGTLETIYIIWNCVGWQTLVLFIITLITGLSGRHTKMSKLHTFIFGIAGTYLVNIFRLVIVVAVYILAGRSFGIVFHDYFSNIFSLLWLFLFWWFSFKYILEEKHQ